MAVTQYIGSRYVPLFADPAEWSDTESYEPLTIVLYEGNSYTSKQFVPVGIDISNDEYWAETGNYNAQVEQYRQEVRAFDSRISDNAEAITAESTARAEAITAESTAREEADNTISNLLDNLSDVVDTKSKKKIAVFIGNSYTEGVGSTSGSDGLRAKLAHLFDETYMFIAGGTGFATYSNHETSFITLLNNAISSASFDNDDVTDIIFTSAMGDTRAACEGFDSLIRTNLATCCSLVESNFPNAQMYVAFAEIVSGRTTQSSYSNKYWLYQLRVHQIFESERLYRNFCYLGWLGWNVNNISGYNSTDGYHPNDAGYNVLASAFINSYNGRTPYTTKHYSADSFELYGDSPLSGRIYAPAALALSTYWPDGIAANTNYKLADIVTDSAISSVIPLQPINSIGIPVYTNSAAHLMAVFIVIDDSTGNAALYARFRVAIASPSSNTFTNRILPYVGQITSAPAIGVG